VKQLEADSVRLNAAMAQSVATHKNAVRAPLALVHFAFLRQCIHCLRACACACAPQVIEQLVSYVTTV
jgi:hypothetical protein